MFRRLSVRKPRKGVRTRRKSVRKSVRNRRRSVRNRRRSQRRAYKKIGGAPDGNLNVGDWVDSIEDENRRFLVLINGADGKLLTNEFKLTYTGLNLLPPADVNKINSKADNRDFKEGDWMEPLEINYYKRVQFKIMYISPGGTMSVEEYILVPKQGNDGGAIHITISADQVKKIN
jgi:hypothetical protein